ncbi:MAG: STAS domain-containing protein [Candidatus Riflebacteria bacterium]|nr:STAS domain-containing protein [Candidatus Riflebacteria bacterium]
MYQQFSATTETRDQVEILILKGYLEDTGGTMLKQLVQNALDAGFSLFALDCTGIELISSPGVAALLDISGLIVDDFAGLLSVWGLDKHHSTVLEMSGFFFMAHQAASEQESLVFLNGS